MSVPQLELLLLWDDAQHVAATVRQHVEALQKYSRHRVVPLAMMADLPVGLDLERFDGVILHYSLAICIDESVSKEARRRLGAYSGLKCLFIQDEYRFVDRSVSAMKDIGINILFTCVPDSEIEKVYPVEALPGVRKVNVLTGYVDDALLNYPAPPYESRAVDIGYRARKVPAWLGELGQEKWLIGQKVARDANRFGLVVDLAYREEERLYGDAWLAFLTNCKATLGVESGASVFDFSGKIQAAVDADLVANPNLSFEELRGKHFSAEEGKIRLNQISPRCFEAAALRTLMILYEGEYSGRLEPWRHYVPLKKDHSNFSEVVALLRDPARACEIVKNAYREVACAYENSFRAMVDCFDLNLSQCAGAGMDRPVRNPYSNDELQAIANRMSSASRRLIFKRALRTRLYFILFGSFFGWLPESYRDRLQATLRRCLAAGRGKPT